MNRLLPVGAAVTLIVWEKLDRLSTRCGRVSDHDGRIGGEVFMRVLVTGDSTVYYKSPKTEGVFWIRGQHTAESEEAQALVAVCALTR